MHVVSIKNGLKLVILFILGILLIISLSLLAYKSFKSLKGDRTIPGATANPTPEEKRGAESTLARLLDSQIYKFVHDYQSTDDLMVVKVDGRLWNQLPSKDRKSYLSDVASVRSILGLKSAVKIVDIRTNTEMSSYEHGRVILGEDQSGS
jgi:hypothetical protein